MIKDEQLQKMFEQYGLRLATNGKQGVSMMESVKAARRFILREQIDELEGINDPYARYIYDDESSVSIGDRVLELRRKLRELK